VSLTAADVAEIMRLVEQSNFDELTLEMDGIKLCLRRGAPAAVVGSPGEGAAGTPGAATPACDATAAGPSAAAPTAAGPAAADRAVAAAGPTSAAPPAATNTATAPADPNVHEVTSPLLGTFYRAPKPGASPFVEVGSQVEEGTVVAIIEVMKLMNTVRAGVRGTVTEILVADGALAEYGETLLRVRKAG
jgi:acetyl-CoA carboxylase biotin carboxyl carrier protein